jgi:hypothetical protein
VGLSNNLAAAVSIASAVAGVAGYCGADEVPPLPGVPPPDFMSRGTWCPPDPTRQSSKPPMFVVTSSSLRRQGKPFIDRELSLGRMSAPTYGFETAPIALEDGRGTRDEDGAAVLA